MNKKRRYVLQIVLDNLERLRVLVNKEEALQIIQESIDHIQICADEEDEAYDNLPDSLQFSTLGDNLSDNISDLTDAIGELETAQSIYEEAENPIGFDMVQTEIIAAVNSISNAINRR